MCTVTLERPNGKYTAHLLRLRLVRRLGQPLIVTVEVGRPIDRSLDAWLDVQPSQAVRFTVADDDNPLMPTAEVLGGSPSGDSLVLVGNATARSKADIDARAFTRHWVHRPNDLLTLARELRAAIIPAPLDKRFSALALGGAEKAAILQRGTDFDFLSDLLHEYARLEPDEAARHVTLVGSAGAKTAGSWVVAWESPDAYAAFTDVEPYSIQFEETDGMPGSWGEALPPWPGLDPARVPAIGVTARLHRKFSTAAWSAWTRRDVPLFLKSADNAFVVGVIDELSFPDRAWDTALETASTGVGLPRPLRGIGPLPWKGIGVLTADATQKPDVAVELPGFEMGHNEVQGQLVTLTDGESGAEGVHLPLFSKSIVDVATSGRFDDRLVVHGNRRRKATAAAPPYVSFKKPSTARCPM